MKRKRIRGGLNSNGPKKEIMEKIALCDEELKSLNYNVNLLEEVKEKKIPFYDKLPKSSKFYTHYMNKMFTTLIQTAGRKTTLESS